MVDPDAGDPPATTTPAVRRPASTFRRRRRRLSAKRQAELERWVADWGLAPDGPPLDLAAVFGRRSDVYLDIGFGHGETTIELATRCPEADVIGVEVHDPGVVTVLDAVVDRGLGNVRVVHGDLLPFLGRIPERALAGIAAFFPDPWPKAGQQHRRLIRGDVVGALTDRLRPGGVLYLATDDAGYAAEMATVCGAEPRLAGGCTDRPSWRPLTRFERRGIDAGRPVCDLRYRRV